MGRKEEGKHKFYTVWLDIKMGGNERERPFCPPNYIYFFKYCRLCRTFFFFSPVYSEDDFARFTLKKMKEKVNDYYFSM